MRNIFFALAPIFLLACQVGQVSQSLLTRALPTSVLENVVADNFLPTPVPFCVTAHVLTLRTGPAVSYPPITWLTMGQELTQLSSVGNWLEVTAGSYRGWVNKRWTGDCL